MNTLQLIARQTRNEVLYGNLKKTSRVYRFPACAESQSNRQTEVAEASEPTGNPDILEYVNRNIYG